MQTSIRIAVYFIRTKPSQIKPNKIQWFIQVLATASEVELGSILNIDYSWHEINFEVAPLDRAMYCKAAAAPSKSFDMDIEPDDINVSDTVTVIWEIC